MHARSLLLLLTLVLAAPARAASLDAGARRAAVEALATALRARHVSADLGEKAARALTDKQARGGYPQTDGASFAEALSTDLQTLTNDRHAGVRFDPGSRVSVDPDTELAPEEKANLGRLLSRQNFGIAEVRILPGNVGFIELRYFAPVDFAAPVLAAAMRLVASTDALVVDLRDNEGGDAQSVAYLASYFFPEGTRVHLADVYDRGKNSSRASWTRAVPGPRYGKPIYLLVSGRTYRGGEELAYDLQVRKRATVVGERTAGVANTGQAFPLGAGLVAFLPTGRAINPVTRTSWEGTGVRPELPAPAAQALEAAHAHALRALVHSETDASYRELLQRLLAMVEKSAGN